MWKVFLIWLLSTLGISVLEFVMWFLFLWFILKKRNLKQNAHKAFLFCLPTKLGIAPYYIKYGYGDIIIFKTMFMYLWKLCSEKILNLRAKYSLLHYFLCVVEIGFALFLGLLSWVVTLFLLIGGGIVVLFVYKVVGPLMKFYYHKKSHIVSFLRCVVDCMMVGLESLPKVKLF